MDIFGNALLDYQQERYTADIKTFSSLDEEDTIPLPYLFRSYGEMPSLEKKALQLCKGKVLDIGAGAGSHSLWLQQHGKDVTALDSSQGAIRTCELRGIKKTAHTDFLSYSGIQFDTLLLLMNGIGIAGKLAHLKRYLAHLRSVLNPNGQILLDSSNIIYMFEQDDDGGYWIPQDVDYYGEVSFKMEYKGQQGPSFDWLYLDFETLKRSCFLEGFNCDLVSEGEHYDYLARLSLL